MVRRGLLLFSLVFSVCVVFSQKLFEDQVNVNAGGGVTKKDAVIYLPAHYSKDKAYPLVIFTHGMGEAGKNIKKLYKQGLPKVLKHGYRPSFDFIMVAVQSGSFSVAPDWLQGILKDCQKRWKIDASRIYLTGISAGGWSIYGSQLNFSAEFAKKFAAIVVNSGVTNNIKKEHLDWWKQTKTPLWAIVGAADRSYVKGNAYMVDEINKRVPNLATLTTRPGVGHGGWTDIYDGKVKLNGKNMWEWLYQFKRSNDVVTKPPVKDPPVPSTPKSTEKYIKVNIYSSTNPGTNATWNNWNVGTYKRSNITISNLKYDAGTPSAIDATLSSSFGVADNGAEYEGGIAPAAVLRYTSASTTKRTLTLTGLSHTKKYKIFLYASRNNRPGYTTLYTINGRTRAVATNNNHTITAYFGDLVPDVKGQIVITIGNHDNYNYINGFKIAEY